MKVILFATIIFISVSCTATTQKDNPSSYVLNKHRELSQFSTPGEFEYLYKNLPESINELSQFIKKQLIHPFDIQKFGKKIPKDRKFEDRDFPTVTLMLKELIKRDENGLSFSRKPEHRLVVACVHHSMLLASILRHREIPVRIRSGFAKYIGDRKDIKVSHVICEIWDQENRKWMLVDPDRQKVNFSRDDFEFANETWNRLRNNNIGNGRYISRLGNTARVTVHLLIHDISYLLGQEKPYWEDPPIVSRINEGISDLTDIELKVFDKIAGYLEDPDNHLKDLEKIVKENAFLQFKGES